MEGRGAYEARFHLKRFIHVLIIYREYTAVEVTNLPVAPHSFQGNTVQQGAAPLFATMRTFPEDFL